MPENTVAKDETAVKIPRRSVRIPIVGSVGSAAALVERLAEVTRAQVPASAPSCAHLRRVPRRPDGPFCRCSACRALREGGGRG